MDSWNDEAILYLLLLSSFFQI